MGTHKWNQLVTLKLFHVRSPVLNHWQSCSCRGTQPALGRRAPGGRWDQEAAAVTPAGSVVIVWSSGVLGIILEGKIPAQDHFISNMCRIVSCISHFPFRHVFRNLRLSTVAASESSVLCNKLVPCPMLDKIKLSVNLF